MDKYHVKGWWSDEGIFNGSIYCNNKKFGSCTRVRSDIINVEPSNGKDEMFKRYKRFLKDNHLKQYNFLTNEIGEFIINNPQKRFKLI
jgi:hypothetical protein